MKKYLIGILLLSAFQIEAASLKDMIKHLGNVSHFNEAGAFQDQSTGHYTAGGMMIRQRKRAINPINIRLPSMGGSCGDFDIRFGGLSFIKGEELRRMLLATAQGVPSYGLQLALKTVAPQVEGVMTNIRTILQKANSLMLNDCWARQQILEGVLPTGSALHQQVCQDMAQSGFNENYTGARDRCMNPEVRNQEVEKAKSKHKDLLVGEFNLVWTVLKKLPQYKNDQDRSEMIMSMVGTVISKKEGENYKVTFIDPLSDEEGFIESHLQGGETRALRCEDSTKCLKVNVVDHVIDSKQSLSSHVWEMISSLKRKYLSEDAFSVPEMVFLSDSVNLPIYKYIQVSASSRVDWPIAKSSQYIALSILLKQFEEVAADILQAVSVLESVQFDNKITKQFKERLELARSRLQQKLQTLDGSQMWMLEKLIRAKEQEMLANYDFERGA